MGEVEKKRGKQADDREEGTDVEVKDLPYPKSVFFIIGNEFCERFSYYGMKSILSLYLKKKLHYSEDVATIIYHTFSMFCYFTPIFGSILADTILGKFKTIVYISVIYVLGHLFKTVAAIPDTIPPVEFSLLGLALIAIGTGGIKPCVAAFGGDQFKLPEQSRQLQTYFSVFYFAINAGSLISTILTPAIREDVECFGDDTCYSLAFGIPAILMAVATVIIILGRPLYVMKPPQGNILAQVVGSIVRALKKRMEGESKEHWLDLAKDKYDHQLVEDTKTVLRVLVIFIPLPVFWALFDQTGSRWTFQATRMNGALGSTTIKPDQMQVINPILVLILIPLFDRIIYPAFAKWGFLVKPLQRMSVGMSLTAASFFISGVLELEMGKTYAKVPIVGESHIHFMNNLPCNVSLRIFDNKGDFVLDSGIEELSNTVLRGMAPNATFKVDMKVSESCLPDILNVRQAAVEVTAMEMQVTPILLGVLGGSVKPSVIDLHDEAEKDDGANSRIRVIYDLGDFSTVTNLTLRGDKNVTFQMEPNVVGGSNYSEIDFGLYEIWMDNVALDPIFLEQGGVYSLVVARNPADNIHRAQLFTLTSPNSIHIFWLIPQYIVITISEIMISVTGLEFSYSQAPDSMKSVLQAGWLLTVAFGNIIVIIVASAKAFDQASEFFMFGVLMILDMFLFMFLAYRYTPRILHSDSNSLPMETKSGVANNNFQSDTEM
jgi:solute carrier family 15 oligopeptide transporter 1